MALQAGLQVGAANGAARAAGVQPGMGLQAALALCPGLQLRPWPQAELGVLRELLAAWAYGYSSQVGWEDETGLCLEVGGSLGLFGPWPRFEQRLRVDLDGLGVQAQLAVAPTPLAARVLAQREDGRVLLGIETLRRHLDSLPIACLPLPAAQQAALAGMGLRQLRQLLALPRAGLTRRFGTELPVLLDRLLGWAPDLRPLYQPPARFQSRFEFDHEIRHSTSLLFPLKRLVGDLCAFLASRDGGVQRFVLSLEHETAPATRWTLGSRTPERAPALLFELARLRLEREPVPAPVVAIGLEADELPPFVPLRQDLFYARPEAALDWPALQARLAARLGEGALYQLELRADPRPERAQSRVSRVASEPSARPCLPRPTWLLPQPRPWPEQDLRLLVGPERIESGWWDGEDLRRDYYLAETRRGQRAWVFCPPGQHGPWMLHGWFA